ncbi:MAG: helix-turn-helix transcriptional regulator [Candidatus Thiodiazotropha sp. (ex Codakia rugifera)]|nr:helix-turn-helix transcriptional regulator [Candidatus Thiodiazotropha sp. (ex Codakia rugifera)]
MEVNNDNGTEKSCDETSCGIRDGLLIIGGKWKSMIMHVLGQHEVIRFNRLKAMIPQISQKMLTQQLRELERDGLVTRKVYPEVPPRVEYSITTLGLSIGHIYREINQWQQKHRQEIEKCREEYDASL